MIIAYGLLLKLTSGLNPFTFYNKFSPVMLTGLSFASSNATLPVSMEVCDKKLGISKKLYSFTLPLGATVNMDGSCIVLAISAFFIMRIFEVPITTNTWIYLITTILVLAIGAPDVPGGCLVCIAVLLPGLGIPAEAISIVMGLYPIVGMILVCTNVTGDAVVTTIVAKGERMLNLKLWGK